jgi:hypothetical protein
MKSSKGILLLACCVLSLSIVFTACGTNSVGQARTYYESLDLATPERTLATFINAFNRTDFWTVWMALAPKAQFAFSQYLNFLQYGALAQLSVFKEFKDEIPTFATGFGSGEHSDYGYEFDTIMLTASRHDAFLIDLRGNLHILSSKESTTTDGKPCVDVLASVGDLASVTFRMVQAPSGRWRVLQVIVPGGDEEQIPWSVPTE